jgi:hypothetical protein
MRTNGLPSPDVLLSEEVPDLDERAALSDGAIDREVSVHCPHLVQVSLSRCSVNKVQDFEPASTNSYDTINHAFYGQKVGNVKAST